MRICVIGDDLTAGIGDPKALGWVGRVVARSLPHRDDLQVLPLAVPGETTTQLAERWVNEVSLRTAPKGEHRLVVGLGAQDVHQGISTARSRLNLANILDVAEQRRLATFVVGPPPGPEGTAEAIGELSAAFADVTSRRKIPYVDTFSPLVHHDQWRADLAGAANPGLPGQAGYGLMAWLVLHGGWRTWLDIPSED